MVAAGTDDCPQFGCTSQRNNVSQATGLPVQWNVGKFDNKTGRWLGGGTKNVLWVARLGSESYATPVVAGGKVFCGTNNGAGYLSRYPAEVDLDACWPSANRTGSSSGNTRARRSRQAGRLTGPRWASVQARWLRGIACGS